MGDMTNIFQIKVNVVPLVPYFQKYFWLACYTQADFCNSTQTDFTGEKHG